MLQQRQKVLAKAPSTHDPKRTNRSIDVLPQTRIKITRLRLGCASATLRPLSVDRGRREWLVGQTAF
jgi:hypothetical protein